MEGKYENIAIEVLRPYTRDAPYPLDATTLFTSYSSAMNYVKNDSSAYPGQIISIDDSVLSKTAVYQVAYDKNGDGLVLEDITVGSGSQAFKFIGSVKTKADLPTTYVLNGDMYYVKGENALYVALKGDKDPSPTWQIVGMDVKIPYATKQNDGIITKEQYSTFFNSKATDAVYFNSPKENTGATPNPEKNRWLSIQRSDSETSDYSLASVGKVKELFKSVTSGALPHIEAYLANGESEFFRKDIANITIAVKYFKELGGSATTVTVEKDEGNGRIPVKTISVESDGSFNAGYELDIQDTIDDSGETHTSVEYLVTVSYKASDEGTIPSDSCSKVIDIGFYDRITYGTNIDDSVNPVKTGFLKSGSSYTINVIPEDIPDTASRDEWKSKAIESVFVTIPTTAAIDYILYVPQMDYSAISLFAVTQNGDGTTTYRYTLPNASNDETTQRFLSRSTFIVKLK